MPRAPQFIHPFRRVRQIIGQSQERAAVALGISASALQQIERGVLPLSEEIATRMLLLTGAKIPKGLCRETIEPIAWDNSPYDSRTLEAWDRYVLGGTVAEEFIETLDVDLKALVDSAWGKGCLFPFMWAIQTALADLARNFGIVREGLLEDKTLSRLFGNLVDRAHASGIELQDALKMAQPVKSAGSKKKRPKGLAESFVTVREGEEPKEPPKAAGSAKKPPKSFAEYLVGRIKAVTAKPEAFAASLRAIMATMKPETVEALARPFEAAKMRPERAEAFARAIMATMKPETVEALARAVTPEFYEPGRAEALTRAFKSDPGTAKILQKAAEEFERAVAEHMPSQLGR